MILHTINKSPYNHTALPDALRCIQSGDIVVLMDDAVYAVSGNPAWVEKILSCGCRCLALAQDLHTRGIVAANGCEVITMEQLVELVFLTSKTVSWY